MGRAWALMLLVVGCPSGDDFGASPGSLDQLSERVEVGPAQRCLSPGADASLPGFEDVTEQAGLAYTPALPEWDDAANGITSIMIEAGGGFVVADLDGDGLLDLLFADYTGPPRLFLARAPLVYEAVDARAAGIETDGAHISAATAADIDADGDLDLWLGGYGRGFLFVNEGDAQFRDATDALGLRGAGNQLAGAFADPDRDGDLDLFVGTHSAGSGGPGQPAINDADHYFVQANGVFTDRAGEHLPADEPAGQAFGASWFDADGDGFLDLYVVNDGGLTNGAPPNRYYRNDGDGSFSELRDNGTDLHMFSMGVATGDYDNDEDLDLHVTDAGWTRLLRNEGRHVFADVSLAVAGFSTPDRGEISWGTEFFDHDHDGVLELFTAFGYMPTKDGGPGGTLNRLDMPDQLWRLRDDGWEDVAMEAGVADPGWSRGVVTADLDGDGFAELITYRLDGGPRVHRSRCNENAWLRVTLVDERGANRLGVGALVVARGGGAAPVTGLVRAGSSTMSAGPPEVLLGLGDRDWVDLEVRWPDGRSETFASVPTRRAVTIRR